MRITATRTARHNKRHHDDDTDHHDIDIQVWDDTAAEDDAQADLGDDLPSHDDTREPRPKVRRASRRVVEVENLGLAVAAPPLTQTHAALMARLLHVNQPRRRHGRG